MASYERDSEGVRRRLDHVVEAQETIQRDMSRLQSDVGRLQADLAGTRSDVKLLKWMLGAIFAAQIAIILRLFLH